MKKIDKHGWGGIILVGGGVVEEWIRRTLRKNGQAKLQALVNKSFEDEYSGDTSERNKIDFEMVYNEEAPLLDSLIEINLDEEESTLKSILSSVIGDSTKTELDLLSRRGLLKCDMSLKDLCRVKNNPNAFRGISLKEGKISKQATFTEVGFKDIAPLMVFQCLATVTSQYYQNIINEQLSKISTIVNNVFTILTDDDRARLRVSFNRFKELCTKNTYDISDKIIVSDFVSQLEIIKEKYGSQLLRIKNLNIQYEWNDKKEAEAKIKCLRQSNYFHHLEMAMQAEFLLCIGNMISIKIANFLGNQEDVKIYLERINLSFWDNYKKQFQRIKHDVLKYLELEEKEAILFKNSIKEMRKAQELNFNNTEEEMMRIQKQLDCKTQQYFKILEDGSVKRFISVTSIKE